MTVSEVKCSDLFKTTHDKYNNDLVAKASVQHTHDTITLFSCVNCPALSCVRTVWQLMFNRDTVMTDQTNETYISLNLNYS